LESHQSHKCFGCVVIGIFALALVAFTLRIEVGGEDSIGGGGFGGWERFGNLSRREVDAEVLLARGSF